jgi:hypothetical protein
MTSAPGTIVSETLSSSRQAGGIVWRHEPNAILEFLVGAHDECVLGVRDVFVKTPLPPAMLDAVAGFPWDRETEIDGRPVVWVADSGRRSVVLRCLPEGVRLESWISPLPLPKHWDKDLRVIREDVRARVMLPACSQTTRAALLAHFERHNAGLPNPIRPHPNGQGPVAWTRGRWSTLEEALSLSLKIHRARTGVRHARVRIARTAADPVIPVENLGLAEMLDAFGLPHAMLGRVLFFSPEPFDAAEIVNVLLALQENDFADAKTGDPQQEPDEEIRFDDYGDTLSRIELAAAA